VDFAALAAGFLSKLSTGGLAWTSFFAAGVSAFGSALGAGFASTLGSGLGVDTGREVLPETGATGTLLEVLFVGYRSRDLKGCGCLCFFMRKERFKYDGSTH
jgi:hypothetical protein